MQDTVEKIKEILSNNCLKDESEFTPGTVLREDLEMDSLDMVEFVMELEEGFHIQIPDDEADKLKTFQDVVNLMQKKVG